MGHLGLDEDVLTLMSPYSETISSDEARIEPITQFTGSTGITVVGGRIWVAEVQLALIAEVAKFYLRSIQLDYRAVPIQDAPKPAVT